MITNVRNAIVMGMAIWAMSVSPLAEGNWAISAPQDEAIYVKTSHIAPNGDMDMGEDVRVQIMTPAPAIADEHFIDSAPMAVTWDWDFTPPTGGWTPVADGWAVYLKDSSGATKDLSTGIEITN